MAGTYPTVQGDMWDGIAYKALGDEGYTDKLIALNARYIDTFIFPAGIVLTLPDVTPTVSASLPPWKRGKT